MTVAPSAADADDTDQSIGFNVHSILYRRKMSQKQLALALGVTPSVLSKKLRGESAWSARQVAITANFLQVEPGRLYDRVTVANPLRNLRALPGIGTHLSAHHQPGITTSVRSVPTRNTGNTGTKSN